ncbi:MAG: helix-turn-helix domain-containing protein [Gammaproteobacteria bacterium]|nr:helix-turn-helix domain-containing protein [Gammaproteobacteria bacterium]
MLNSENLKFFDNNRPEFKPYGFTVEKWTPKLMSKPDRHNEIEINLLTGGSLTYLINDRKVKVKAKRLAIFWALIPHQIIQFDNDAPYYVCTIPFAQFMSWQFPFAFVNYVLKGEVVNATTNKDYSYDKYLMEAWLQDISAGDEKYMEVSTMEMCARLHRFALNSIPAEWNEFKEGDYEYSQLDIVEKMTIFIARNYQRPIKNIDIGKAVGLHPDYANTIFRKSFGMTLNQYVIQQRILYARRQLSVSDKSITEIAYEAGFNSVSRFNAAFKEKCNCTPRNYRKIHSQTFNNAA